MAWKATYIPEPWGSGALTEENGSPAPERVYCWRGISCAVFFFYKKPWQTGNFMVSWKQDENHLRGSAMLPSLFWGLTNPPVCAIIISRTRWRRWKTRKLVVTPYLDRVLFLCRSSHEIKKWFWGWQTRNLWYNNIEVGRMICRRLTISPEIRSWGWFFRKVLTNAEFVI